MKARSVALAIAALALWLIPSGSLAQGNSGKTSLTICHIPPGNPDVRRTVTVAESAWGAHESHGDTLGPCDGYSERHSDGYGAETKRAKKAKKKKGKKEYRGGSDGDEADDEIEADDRAGEREEIDEADSESEGEEIDEIDETGEPARREPRAGRRSKRGAPSDGQTADDTGEEERGFFRGMRQFFGFGGDASEE
jgi:hypothetical protein